MVRVMLFAGLAEISGSPEVTLNINQEPLSIKQVRSALIEKYPAMSSLLEHSLVAVNQEYAEPEQIVTSSDEIAIIPPVSGG